MLSSKPRRWPAAALVIVLGCAFPLLQAGQQTQPSPATHPGDSKSGPPGAPPQPTPSPTPGLPSAPSPEQRRAPESVVLIDPSHGGEDKGVVFSNKLLEKDVTLSLGRELRKELWQRGIPARMLREGDVSIGLDRRAEFANEPHIALYVALHAGRPGKGVRVYAPVVMSPQPPVGRFLVWDSAQAGSQERSRKFAQAVANELKRKEIQVSLLRSSLRPLNNIVPPAIAVELAPEAGNPRSLESEKLQNAVASAIAAAVAQNRSFTGGRH